MQKAKNFGIKEKELKKQKIGAHESEVKGIRLSIRISEHDLDVKRQQAEKFLERGDRAKVEIILRGRENAKAGLAFDTLNKFFTLISQNQSVRYETEPARQANRISAKAVPVKVEVDRELGSHFKVTYDTGEAAEVSWSFIRELPPAK